MSETAHNETAAHDADRSTTTLVLAAHGAADDPRCAAPVLAHVERLRSTSDFAGVEAIFWKQPPAFADIDLVAGDGPVIVVPLLTASGYYARTILPRELGLDDPARARRIRVTTAIGELDGMADLVIAQARAVFDGPARLLLVGHGTRRDPARSGETTHRHAGAIAARNVFASVHPAFLEQDPTVADAFAGIPGDEPVVVVPFLIASGGHGADDIPADLGAPTGATHTTVHGRDVHFARAAGEHPDLAALVLEATETAP